MVANSFSHAKCLDTHTHTKSHIYWHKCMNAFMHTTHRQFQRELHTSQGPYRPKCLSNGKNIFLSTLLHHLRYMHGNCFHSLQVRICNLQGNAGNGEMMLKCVGISWKSALLGIHVLQIWPLSPPIHFSSTSISTLWHYENHKCSFWTL